MRLEFAGNQYEVAPGETVLECLERHGEHMVSSCRSGVCQCCLVRATSGSVPRAAQQGLRQALRDQGLFMPCVCRPESDLVVERSDAVQVFDSRVLSVESLSPRVIGVQLAVPDGLRFAGGQFIQLVRPTDGLMRSYSIASLPDEGLLQLHVSRQRGGIMSEWLSTAAGEAVKVRGPLGECSYVAGEPDRPLLLAGTGTGLAPLFAVLRAALHAGHAAPIHLFHGAAELRELYLWRELQELAQRYPNLHLQASVADAGQGAPGITSRPLTEQVLASGLPPGLLRAWLCGNPDFVRGLRKQLYLAGASLERIHADPFIPPAAGH